MVILLRKLGHEVNRTRTSPNTIEFSNIKLHVAK